MTIDVLDFYTNRKLSIHPKFNKSLSEGNIILLIDKDGVKKEIAVHIPKKYCFERRWIYSIYDTRKAMEFEILSDYLSSTKEAFKQKMGFSEGDFWEMAISLRCLMNRKYAKCNAFKQFMLGLGSEWDLFKYRLKRIWSE